MAQVMRRKPASGLATVTHAPWGRSDVLTETLSSLTDVIHEACTYDHGIDSSPHVYFTCDDIGSAWWQDVTAVPDTFVTCLWCAAGLRRRT
jgi:hypothetical protein